MKKLLIIGSLPIEGIKSTYGGTTVLLQQFIDYCVDNSINHDVIQTNRYQGRLSMLINWFCTINKLIFKVGKNDVVMFHAAKNGWLYFSPIVYIIARIFNKKFVLRKFGGGAIDLYNEASWANKKILKKTVFKADVTLFETKQIVNYFTKKEVFRALVHWYPNTRNSQNIKNKRLEFGKKFAFISHVKKTKGISEILLMDDLLPDGYQVDIYGPINRDDYNEQDLTLNKVKYRGTLKPQDVINTLSQYDVLLLPTYHEGEGYPGVILEAFSLAIPVVSTFWRAVPEVVIDGVNGILVPPKKHEELFSAMMSFSDENYSEYSKNALDSFYEYFDANSVNNQILQLVLR